MDYGPTEKNHNEYVDALEKLFTITKFLGFYRSSIKLLKKFSAHAFLMDLGCGGGLFLLHLSQKFPDMQMVGIDIAPEAIKQAQLALNNWQKKISNSKISFKLQQSSKLEMPNDSVDVILTTLVCHHMTDLEMIEFLHCAYQCARKAVIINDLHRHFFAEFFYFLISPLFHNKMITHDGLISIRRSFKYKELIKLITLANIQHYQIKWRFPFRWEIILWR